MAKLTPLGQLKKALLGGDREAITRAAVVVYETFTGEEIEVGGGVVTTPAEVAAGDTTPKAKSRARAIKATTGAKKHPARKGVDVPCPELKAALKEIPADPREYKGKKGRSPSMGRPEVRWVDVTCSVCHRSNRILESVGPQSIGGEMSLYKCDRCCGGR